MRKIKIAEEQLILNSNSKIDSNKIIVKPQTSKL